MYRPRSIFSLLLIGFPVVLAPLIAAIVTAVVQVDRLAAYSHSAVLEAELATHQSRRLVERLTEMRRPFLQYQVTGDADFLQIYSDRRERFLDTIRNLGELELTDLGRDQLERLSQEELGLVRMIEENSHDEPGGTSPVDMERTWNALIERARVILSEGSSLIEAQANNMTTTAAGLQRNLLLQATAIIPASLLLSALFVVLINRPMRQLAGAIRHLGAGEFARPITVLGSRDVEELGQQLDWLRRRIQELEQQKLTFLRHISHELKTPLTTIREGSELLAEALASGAPEEAEISRIMNGSSLQLQRLIEDLLMFSQMQDIVSDLKLEEAIDMQELVTSAVDGQSVASGAKQIEVQTRLAPAFVRGDRKKIYTVIDNLVSNAIKYTPSHGQVRVTLGVADRYSVVDVEDSGPGISASERERIFLPFQQGSAECRSSVSGTGLGLSIAKEYAEIHDGYIQVVDADQGAHFRAVFPVEGPSAGT